MFDEDAIRHYQEPLERRRQIRLTDEYRGTTADEWTEFAEHVGRRKVELGSCGRPYGAPCQHEHACIRCPMLHVNPKMPARLREFEADLLSRRTRAEAEVWVGEIEAIDLTLPFLRAQARPDPMPSSVTGRPPRYPRTPPSPGVRMTSPRANV